MKIKKYTAPTMREALLLIKQDLGEDAVILKSRKLPRKLLSLHEQDEVEVTAAIDESIAPAAAPPLGLPATGVYQRPKRPAPAMPSYAGRVPEARQSPERSSGAAGDEGGSSARPDRSEVLHYLELREDVREVKELIKSVLRSGSTSAAGGFTDGWAVLYKRLVDSEVKPDIAAQLVADIQRERNGQDVPSDKDLIAILGRHLPVAGPVKLDKNGPVVIAFVGPTGAGKTTTLAKLAAYLALNKEKMVSIITADTYRIAAIEQIRTFADIIGIGLQVVFEPGDVPAILEACENDDAVFVDTGGRSQKNVEHMKDLEQLLAVLHPHETHLVLSAATKDSDLVAAINRYRGMVNRVLFTKLDETSSLGNIFNVATQSGIPLSYFTNGQSIPDDIELAQPGHFIQRLWEGSVL
jgi:flagellar biosynthesis protein FlhF